MKLRRLLPIAIALLTLFGIQHAVQAIELGDPAPELAIKEWIKGTEVDLKKPGKDHVYVVEFWATWCGPCRTSIPHLSELQASFKDQNVTIIGISDETAAKVKPFVKQMGAKMDYTVAIDTDRTTYKNYMGAFGVGGIPHAFIVNQKGQLAWHGHPMDRMEEVLKEVVAGTFDIAAYQIEAKRVAAQQQLFQDYFGMVTEGQGTPKSKELGLKIVSNGAENPDLLNQFAWLILTHPAVKDRDLDIALKAGKAAYKATGGKDAAIVDTYARALFDSGKVDESIRVQREAIAACKDPEMRASLEETLDRYRLEASKK